MFDWFKKKEKDISEPVISFVKLVKDNPKRFKLNLNNKDNRDWLQENYHLSYWYALYRLYDKVEDEYKIIGVLEDHHPSKSYYMTCQNISYLTCDEIEYVLEKLKPIFEARKDKLDEIKAKRKVRDDQKKRQRDIEKYCK